MAKCGGWYYTKPPWHHDAVTAVTGESGSLSKRMLHGLGAGGNNDAKVLYAYLLALQDGNDRNPFRCAEPHAVYQLLEKGAELNEIFIGSACETAYAERRESDVDRWLAPCTNCQTWLTARLKDGSYMIDMGELNRFVRNSRLSWWQ